MDDQDIIPSFTSSLTGTPGKDLPPESTTPVLVTGYDGTAIVYPPGYEYGSTTPTAWIKADDRMLERIQKDTGIGGWLILQTKPDEQEADKTLVEVNLYLSDSARTYNELTGNRFARRVEALRDVQRFESCTGYTRYCEKPGPPIVHDYIHFHKTLEQAQTNFRDALLAMGLSVDTDIAPDLDIGTREELNASRLKNELNDAITAYDDFMQTLRDAYLKSKGLEKNIDPVEALRANEPATRQRADAPSRSYAEEAAVLLGSKTQGF